MPADHHPHHTDTALIIGCGYLGKRLASRLIERGHTVYGTTRSQTNAQALAAIGVRPLLLAVTQPVTYASLTPALQTDALNVYYLVPPGRLDGSPSTRQIVLGGIAHMIKALKQANLKRAVMASSSAVYGQQDGQSVDADTPAKPAGERAELLLQGEALWLDAGPKYRVLRLAGLYGPKRVVGLKAVREGAPLLGNPQALLNLIHADDAVSLLLAMADRESSGRIELGCDGHPTSRIQYYRYLAKKLGVAAPASMDDPTAARRFGLNPDRLARASNKALDNTATRRRTGWAPAVTDFRLGLDAILGSATNPQPKPAAGTC